MPKLSPCTVTVKQDGKPLQDAMVLLQKGGGQPFKWSVAGRTDAAGVAKVMTHGQFSGAPEGDYAVVISKEVTEQAKSGQKQLDDLGNEIDTGGMISSYSLVEKEYTAADTTPLKITVGKTAVQQEFECGKPVRILLRQAAP
ncbi:MAG: hypothetical protein LBN39_06625 [Planctomycetaceae bacterium]|nr:hypothetical protein [Planctomycetaceae bacterium]